MKLQKAWERMHGRIREVRMKIKLACQPKMLVYASWKTEISRASTTYRRVINRTGVRPFRHGAYAETRPLTKGRQAT
jgi:hypothetical protein